MQLKSPCCNSMWKWLQLTSTVYQSATAYYDKIRGLEDCTSAFEDSCDIPVKWANDIIVDDPDVKTLITETVIFETPCKYSFVSTTT